jgi:hypothetical protein
MRVLGAVVASRSCTSAQPAGLFSQNVLPDLNPTPTPCVGIYLRAAFDRLGLYLSKQWEQEQSGQGSTCCQPRACAVSACSLLPSVIPSTPSPELHRRPPMSSRSQPPVAPFGDVKLSCLLLTLALCAGCSGGRWMFGVSGLLETKTR